jgi:hypothetical protein
MAADASTALTSDVSPLTPISQASSSFDDRWEAWQAKGAAHDRAVRRRLALAAPFLVIVTGALLYAFVLR